MAESPRDWWLRVRALGNREEQLSQWSTWPWTGELSTKQLDEPADAEPDRRGAGGVGCFCAGTLESWPGLVWADDLFVLGRSPGTSLPLSLSLLPRRHADLSDLTAAEAARQGELLWALERAAVDVLEVPRIQVARWADGSEHLHWVLLARPTGALQLRGTFLALWEEVLPPREPDAQLADALAVAHRLTELAGGRVLV